jgi:hypothetical protein
MRVQPGTPVNSNEFGTRETPSHRQTDPRAETSALSTGVSLIYFSEALRTQLRE